MNRRKKRIIVINLGWEQEVLLDKLLEYELDIYGIHYNEAYYKSPNYKDLLITDLRDLNRILRFAEKIRPDAVISDQCDYSYFAQALIAEKFNLPGPRIKEAQIATNKFLQRTLAREMGIHIPEFKLSVSIDDVYSFAKEVGFPVITKPVDNRGSFGVNKVENESDVEEAYYDALINSHSRFILVEKFIDGIHITVDGYAFKNEPKSLSLATKMLVGNKRQVAMDILYPGELEPKIYEQSIRYNEFVNSNLGFKFGMTHSEYMIKDGKVYLIESANRGGGVYTSEVIVPNVSGIDIVSQYVNDALGENKNFYFEKVEKNQVLLKFFKFNPGYVKEIKNLEGVRASKNVLKFRVNVKEGDLIKEITTDANRHGFLIVKDIGNIRSKAEHLTQSIEVVYG